MSIGRQRRTAAFPPRGEPNGRLAWFRVPSSQNDVAGTRQRFRLILPLGAVRLRMLVTGAPPYLRRAGHQSLPARTIGASWSIVASQGRWRNARAQRLISRFRPDRMPLSAAARQTSVREDPHERSSA
jgi:hypothetical protein